MTQFPGDLSELAFVEAYWRGALKKPQMAADAALRTLVFAELADRATLTGLIAQELAEAARRLVAVHDALADRTHSIAKSLLQPLPGVERWNTFIQLAGTLSPQQMLNQLHLGDEALDAATTLRAQPSLADLTGLIAAAEAGNPMLLIPYAGGVASEIWVAGIDASSAPVASAFGATESDATNLADIVGDLTVISRGFLGAYLGHRRSAGQRD